jgi:hypothetical protein
MILVPVILFSVKMAEFRLKTAECVQLDSPHRFWPNQRQYWPKFFQTGNSPKSAHKKPTMDLAFLILLYTVNSSFRSEKSTETFDYITEVLGEINERFESVSISPKFRFWYNL